MILVSSCLAGLEVRYNATHCLNNEISQLIEQKKAVAVCPELLGGFSTPREPAEIIGGDGTDVLEGRAKGRPEHIEESSRIQCCRSRAKGRRLLKHRLLYS